MSEFTVYSTYGRYWHGDSGASGDESLYAGYHASSRYYRSRIQFNTSAWSWGGYNVKDITILSARLELFPRGFYASSVRTASTWIVMNNVSASGDTEYTKAKEAGGGVLITGEKPLENHTKHSYRDSNNPTRYYFTQEFVTRLEGYCKANNGAGSVFSIFIGGASDVQGVIFAGRNPNGVSKSLVPRLVIEYVPSASTGTITTSIGQNQAQATVNITRNVDTYTHGIIWTINGIALTERTGIATSNTFTINSDSLVKKYFPATASSISCSCKIITYSNGTPLGEKTVNFTLSPPTISSISWSDEPYILADNSKLRYESVRSENKTLIAGFSKPIIHRGTATSNTGATISKYLIDISSCGVTVTNLELTASDTTINKVLSSSSSDRNFVVKIQTVDSRGRKSEEKQIFINGGSSCICYGYTEPSFSTIEGPVRVNGFTQVSEGQTGNFGYNTAGYFEAVSTKNGYNFDKTEKEEGEYIYLKVFVKKTSINNFNKITSSKTLCYEQGDTTKEIFVSDDSCTKTNSLKPSSSSSATNRYYRKTTKDSNGNITAVEFYIPADPESIYLLKLNIFDYVSSKQYEYTVYSTSYIIHIRRGGKSLGLGAAAKETEKTIYCGWELNLKEPLKIDFGGTGSSSFNGLAQNLSPYLLPIEGGTLTDNLTINRKSATSGGIYIKDSTGATPGALYYNGTNLWIGSTDAATAHHRGGTYISAGYNGTTGNDSIYVSIPNSSNNGASSHKVYHAGNLFYSAANGNIPTEIPGGSAIEGMIWLCPVD